MSEAKTGTGADQPKGAKSANSTNGVVVERLITIDLRLTTLEVRVTTLETQMTEVKTEVAGLKTDVAGLKTDVAGLKTDVAGLKTDVAGLKTEVAEVKTAVAKLEAKVDEGFKHMATKEDLQKLAVTFEKGQNEMLKTLNRFMMWGTSIAATVLLAVMGTAVGLVLTFG